MALPFSRNTTYVPTTTPSIKAADLNALQDGVGQAFTTCSFTPPMTGVDTPQIEFKDTAGNIRSVVDKNGFYQSLHNHFAEDWFAPPETPTNTSFIRDRTTPWSGDTFNATISQVIPTNSYAANLMRFTSTGAATAYAALYSGSFFPADYVSMRFNVDMKTYSVAANATYAMGFSDNDTSPFTAQQTLKFLLTGSGSNWKIYTDAGPGFGLPVVVDSGVAALNGVITRFQIEWHGQVTPIGIAPCYGKPANHAKALFYINGVLVAAVADSSLPTQTMALLLHASETSSAAFDVGFGPVRVSWNRWASIDAI